LFLFPDMLMDHLELDKELTKTKEIFFLFFFNVLNVFEFSDKIKPGSVKREWHQNRFTVNLKDILTKRS
jgi:hypothetical protein